MIQNSFLQWYATSFQIVLKEENIIYMVFIVWYFVGNKIKGRISKQVFQKNKVCQIFQKNAHSLPPDTHTIYALGHRPYL